MVWEMSILVQSKSHAVYSWMFLDVEQTRRREMIILVGEWRNIGTTEVQALSIYLWYCARTCSELQAIALFF